MTGKVRWMPVGQLIKVQKICAFLTSFFNCLSFLNHLPARQCQGLLTPVLCCSFVSLSKIMFTSEFKKINSCWVVPLTLYHFSEKYIYPMTPVTDSPFLSPHPLPLRAHVGGGGGGNSVWENRHCLTRADFFTCWLFTFQFECRKTECLKVNSYLLACLVVLISLIFNLSTTLTDQFENFLKRYTKRKALKVLSSRWIWLKSVSFELWMVLVKGRGVQIFSEIRPLPFCGRPIKLQLLSFRIWQLGT